MIGCNGYFSGGGGGGGAFQTGGLVGISSNYQADNGENINATTPLKGGDGLNNGMSGALGYVQIPNLFVGGGGYAMGGMGGTYSVLAKNGINGAGGGGGGGLDLFSPNGANGGNGGNGLVIFKFTALKYKFKKNIF